MAETWGGFSRGSECPKFRFCFTLTLTLRNPNPCSIPFKYLIFARTPVNLLHPIFWNIPFWVVLLHSFPLLCPSPRYSWLLPNLDRINQVTSNYVNSYAGFKIIQTYSFQGWDLSNHLISYIIVLYNNYSESQTGNTKAFLQTPPWLHAKRLSAILVEACWN